MATNCFINESASYRAAGNIQERIEARIAEGNTHQEAELKGVEEFAIECSILKVAVSEDVQNCTDEGIQILEAWDSLKIRLWNLLGEMLALLVSMKEQMKLTECYPLVC